MTDSYLRKRVDEEVTRRGLASLMNDTRWRELRDAVRKDLPFPPAYQLKVVFQESPDPERFETDVEYWGDWSDESLSPFYVIEWMRVRPRFVRRRGRLVPPEIVSVEHEFAEILHRCRIPHRHDGESWWIYGYAADTADLVRAGGRGRCSPDR